MLREDDVPRGASAKPGFGALFGRSRFSLRAGGFSLASMTPTVPEREVVRHSHDDAHFVLVTRGTYITTARGAATVCDPPVLVFNPPGTTHRDRFLSKDGSFLTIAIADATLRQAAGALPLPEPAVLLGRDAVSLAERLVRLGDSADADPALALTSLTVESLCFELLGEASRGSAFARGSAPGWLKRAVERLEDADRNDAASLTALAAEIGVHPVHLTRTFRQHFRMTPGEYLRRCRVERAAALLAGSRAPLSEVALASGFCDQSHLSRAFRRAYRMTPGEYRGARSSR